MSPGHAWRFIRDLAAGWMGPLTPDDGYQESELEGIRMPDALRQAYRLFGRRADLTSNQDQLVAPAKLTPEADGRLVFRRENQGCTAWAVADVEHPDPPVEFQVGLEWRPYLASTSLACVEMVLSETLLGWDDHADNRWVDRAAMDAVDRAFSRVPFPEYPMWAVPNGPPVRWYSGDDCLLRCDAEEWLWVIARTPAALEDVYAAVPGEWELRTRQ
ncbi:hypothetical protein ALI144C_50540 [Actinosynnema sp. ALI-1.44]|uniref:hypothetical protein n=1 Tax=Actinosynnema sp. ALI-1.44 TaxID=1933779 RepID=UPI00097C8585|nr:hypothetical protein [Actinosynnema sp. ALI-1.44]ONI70840.1 hypothetical protein ALI144C_50540 [Actinosynnema sp. ALI-1.44]